METEYTISEVAQQVGRAAHTVRMWEYHGRLPEHLRSRRNERGWRVWTAEQVDGIITWLVEADIRPGKGLRHG